MCEYHTAIHDEDLVPSDAISKIKEMCSIKKIEFSDYIFSQFVNEVGIEYSLSYEHNTRELETISLVFKRDESDQMIDVSFSLTQD